MCVKGGFSEGSQKLIRFIFKAITDLIKQLLQIKLLHKNLETNYWGLSIDHLNFLLQKVLSTFLICII